MTYEFSSPWWIEGLRAICRGGVYLFFVALIVGFLFVVTNPGGVICAFDHHIGGATSYAECANPEMIRAREARRAR